MDRTTIVTNNSIGYSEQDGRLGQSNWRKCGAQIVVPTLERILIDVFIVELNW